MSDTIKDRTFDVIVIGSGMSGGWAAKEFCEKGPENPGAGAGAATSNIYRTIPPLQNALGV
jgi:glycine/D-amino acid oxidase-like deaminating enzyme